MRIAENSLDRFEALLTPPMIELVTQVAKKCRVGTAHKPYIAEAKGI